MSLTVYIENDYIFCDLVNKSINPDITLDLNVNFNTLVRRCTYETDTSGKAFDYYTRLFLTNDFGGLKFHWLENLTNKFNESKTSDSDRDYILDDYIIGLEDYYDDADILTKSFYLAIADTAWRSPTFPSFRQYMPDDIAMDLSLLINSNIDMLESLKSKAIIHTPGFDYQNIRSINIGGADGDLIIDDILYDTKSTFFANYSPKKDLPQLVGYYFLSKFTEYKIKALGLILPRHKMLWSKTIDELFLPKELLKAEKHFFNKEKRIKVKGYFRSQHELIQPIYN